MSESLFSDYWYRVENLKPVLRNSTVVSRHVYRKASWYVLQNRISGRSHRFNSAAYALIGQMDGERTVAQIWENAGKRSIHGLAGQDEFIRMLGQLHEADLIQSDILPSTMNLLTSSQKPSASSWQQRIANPFSLRFSLCDPDRFLDRWSFLARPLFTYTAFLFWLLIVSGAAVLAAMHWPDISSSLADQLFIPSNLFMLCLIYPLVKILHECGHAVAIKRWGGEVHETGIILLALMPIPYVDAGASASFPEKKHRMIVAAMGMIVELLLASLALFVWLNVETGFVSAVAYNIMLIGGVSTVLFNGNPLLRYDGYYILSDAIEIPNLQQRSTRFLGYLLRRYLLGISSAQSPTTAPGEAGWFFIYGVASFFYRIAIVVLLVWMVSDRFFFVGVVIALWGLVSLLILPAYRGMARFMRDPAISGRKIRFVAGTAITAAIVVLALWAVPMPLWTNAQGVVWLPEKSVIRAGTDCEVNKVLAAAEQKVDIQTPLVQGTNPFLDAELKIYRARLQELVAGYNAMPLHERVKRRILIEEIEQVKGDLQQTEEKIENLLIRSPAHGKFVLIEEQNLPGRFLKQGEQLGYIVSEQRPTIRAVVKQTDIGLIREGVSAVQVRLTEQIDKPLPARIERIIPAADLDLPTAALGTGGGGNIPIDPADPRRLRALETHFQLELSLPAEIKNAHIGGRAYIRFEHGRMPMAMQWYRTLRQLFLRKFYV